MKQVNFTILLIILMSMVGAKTFAHDIAIANANGVTIYYNYINKNTELAVTFLGSYYSINTDRYVGSVTIPQSVTYNGKTYNVTSINDYAFYGCSGLTKVTIPNSITSIGWRTFEGCNGLTEVTIPNSVTSIAGYAFSKCSGLQEVTISDGTEKLLFSGQWSNGYCFLGSPIKKLYIGRDWEYESYTTAIPFKGMTSKANVVIGGNVTSIGAYAFYYCDGLAEVTIGNGVTSIGKDAFCQCDNLTSVIIGNGVTSIGEWAFFSCDNLTSLTIGNNVTTIGEYAFSSCDRLTKLVIPNSVISIDNNAFSYCNGLTELIIPNSVTFIGDFAFHYCTGLKSATIGSGVLSIGLSAFLTTVPMKVLWLAKTPPFGYYYAGNSGINYVTNDQYYSLSNKTIYPFLSSMFEVDGVKYVPVSVSDRTCDVIDCIYSDSIENLHIGTTVINQGVPLTIKQIHPYAFYDNRHIKNIELSLDGNIGEYAFYGCSALESAKLDNNGEIGDYAFYECTSLENIIAGNGVTSIGSKAFSGCSNLDSFEFGSAMNRIGWEAFSNCTSLTKIISHALTPPTCGNLALDDINKWTCTLSVPMGYAAAYQQADQWKDFFFINDDVEITGIENVLSDSTGYVVVYTLGGIKRIMNKVDIKSLPRGIYVINGKKVIVK